MLKEKNWVLMEKECGRTYYVLFATENGVAYTNDLNTAKRFRTKKEAEVYKGNNPIFQDLQYSVTKV